MSIGCCLSLLVAVPKYWTRCWGDFWRAAGGGWPDGQDLGLIPVCEVQLPEACQSRRFPLWNPLPFGFHLPWKLIWLYSIPKQLSPSKLVEPWHTSHKFPTQPIPELRPCQSDCWEDKAQRLGYDAPFQGVSAAQADCPWNSKSSTPWCTIWLHCWLQQDGWKSSCPLALF